MQPKYRAILTGLLVVLVTLVAGTGVQADMPAEPVEQQAQFALPIFVVNTPFLNVRTGPGVQYTVLAVARGGTELPVLGVARDRVWYLVSTAVGNGWINAEFALPRGDFRNVPLIDTSDIEAPATVQSPPAVLGLPPDPGQGGGVVVPGQGGAVAPGQDPNRIRARLLVSAVNLRVSPDPEAAFIDILFRDEGTDYAIVGQATDDDGVQWLAIVVPDVGTGWVEAAKTRPSLNAAFGTVLTIIADSVALSPQPGNPLENQVVLSGGDEVYLRGLLEDGRVVVETINGVIGTIPFESQTTRTGTPTDSLAPRSGQAPSASPVVVQPGVVAPVVQVPPGQPALQLPVAIVNTPRLNIRSGPGAQFTVVATVDGGTQFPVIGFAPDEVWWLVSGNFGEGWVNEEFVLFRGDLSNVPLVRDTVVNATIARPIAVVSTAIPLLAAPRSGSTVLGTVVGPLELPVVARTPDFNWVQLETSLGFGWVQASQVTLRGDGSLIPIVN